MRRCKVCFAGSTFVRDLNAATFCLKLFSDQIWTFESSNRQSLRLRRTTRRSLWLAAASSTDHRNIKSRSPISPQRAWLSQGCHPLHCSRRVPAPLAPSEPSRRLFASFWCPCRIDAAKDSSTLHLANSPSSETPHLVPCAAPSYVRSSHHAAAAAAIAARGRRCLTARAHIRGALVSSCVSCP